MYDPQKLKTKCKGIAKENKFGVNENSRQIILILLLDEYYELLEHCLGSLEQVKSKGWSRTEPAPIF